MFFKKYICGDWAAVYAECPVEGHPKKTVIGFTILPKDAEIDPKKLGLDSLVQVAFAGDETLVDYTRGVTMRNRSSTLLKVERQVQFVSGNINTYLSDGAGNEYVHKLSYCRETGVFTLSVRYDNRTGGDRLLEHLSSFSVSGLGAPGGTEGFVLHRMTSAWSRECRWKRDEFSRLGLDMSWARYGVKVEKWGEVGSMANRGYYPFAAVEGGGTVLGVQLEAPYSWQIELYKEKETCALSGGLADYETGHWRKRIANGEGFETHRAFLAVRRTLSGVCNALVHEQERRLSLPKSEEGMPILFNEYCTTWGCPSAKNIARILKAIKDFPIDDFVIDCGWYKPDDKGWCNAIGDWQESAALFPEGIEETVAQIKAAGKRAGIWFEFEIAGRDSKLFSEEEMFLKRDGAVITAKNRRFLDLRKEEVKHYLSERFLRFLKEKGFSYLKIDYNDAFGIGCDGAESLGEGGRQVAEESIAMLDTLRERMPDLVIENCSSGGSRIEPLRMGKVSMCSFSDAHECPEIPLVAANVSLAVPARQMQIWAVIRKEEPVSRTIYSLCAAMMGRICLSGDVLRMPPERKETIAAGLVFYQTVKEIVCRGDVLGVDCDIEYYRRPRGRQIYVKEYRGRRLVIVHFLEAEGEARIPAAGFALGGAYTDLPYSLADGVLTVEGAPFHAGAFLLEKV